MISYDRYYVFYFKFMQKATLSRRHGGGATHIVLLIPQPSSSKSSRSHFFLLWRWACLKSAYLLADSEGLRILKTTGLNNQVSVGSHSTSKAISLNHIRVYSCPYFIVFISYILTKITSLSIRQAKKPPNCPPTPNIPTSIHMTACLSVQTLDGSRYFCHDILLFSLGATFPI